MSKDKNGVMMDLIKLMLIIFMLSSFACSSQRIQQKTQSQDYNWHKSFEDKFFLEYRIYSKEILPECSDFDRDIAFDIERKIRALHDFSFQQIMNIVSIYIEENNLDFDSIFIKNIHSPHFEEEYKFAPTYVEICLDNDIRNFIINRSDEDKYTMNKTNIALRRDKINVSSGCGYGYTVLTVFYPDNRFELLNIAINPDDSY